MPGNLVCRIQVCINDKGWKAFLLQKVNHIGGVKFLVSLLEYGCQRNMPGAEDKIQPQDHSQSKCGPAR